MSDNTPDTTEATPPEESGLDKAKQAATGAKDKAAGAAKKAGEKVPPQVKDTYGKVSDKARDAAKKATPVVKDTYGKVSSKVKGMRKPDGTTDTPDTTGTDTPGT